MKLPKSYRYLLILSAWLCTACLTAGAKQVGTKSRLELARENLRVSQATERRIASELEQLKSSGDTPTEVISDYETYASRVQAMVEENERMVREMEAAYTRHLPSQGPSTAISEKSSSISHEEKNPDEEELDEVAALDRELNDSLAEFDDMLLKEMDRIRERSSAKMTDLAAEAAAAADVLAGSYSSVASEAARAADAIGRYNSAASSTPTASGGGGYGYYQHGGDVWPGMRVIGAEGGLPEMYVPRGPGRIMTGTQTREILDQRNQSRNTIINVSDRLSLALAMEQAHQAEMDDYSSWF